MHLETFKNEYADILRIEDGKVRRFCCVSIKHIYIFGHRTFVNISFAGGGATWFNRKKKNARKPFEFVLK